MAVVKVTPKIAEQAVRDTDWAAVDAQTDEEIARNVAEDPDAAPILTGAGCRMRNGFPLSSV